MYSDAYPGLDHYWRELSYNTINVVGSGAVGWYTLPQPRSYYVYDMNEDGEVELDRGRAANDCTAVADGNVYFPNYVGINLMFNYDLDLYAWGGSRYMILDGVSKVWYMTWEPPWGYQNIGVIDHETGHGFGLPHSSGAYGKTYDNQWDVMSDHWSGCYRDGQDHSDPVYGCLGQHTISYHKDILGWITAGRKYIATPGSQATITLEQLTLPQTSNYLMAQIPIRGSATHFYTIEARRLVGYDSHNPLPGQAVIIHEVDTARMRPAYVVDVDNNGNTGDAGAMWTPGEAFIDETNGITVSVDLTTTTGFIVAIESQALQLSNVDISGPTSGIVQASYTFTATTRPITATQPITYVWQATGQSPLTHTGGLSDTVTFNWSTPGSQTITVTAANARGMVTNNHIVDVYVPPATVDISGPTSGIVQASYTFTAAISPITATQPITYVWQATGQSPLTHTGGLSDTVAFAWSTPGTQTITVTAANAGGTITNTYIVNVYVPPTSVGISGPTSGIVQASYTFTATTSPITATQPITYVWQATGQSPLTHTGGLSDTVTFNWSTPGSQTITVTAANAGGMVTDTHIVNVYVPPASVDVSGPTSGIVQASYTFTAAISPITATQPITYVWQATGQPPLTHMGGLSDTVTFNWSTPGSQTITVTAANAGGTITNTYIVTVYTTLYLPLIMHRH
jgi:M6 family metalloprotease-like protein